MSFINRYIGMRTFKTALAVAICILISTLSNTNYPIFACISAICAMNPSFNGITTSVKEQLLGTTFGIILGSIYSMLIPDVIFAKVPAFFVGIILVILFCIKLNVKMAIQLACIVFIDVYLFGGNSPNFVYGLNRLFDTSWGLFVAVFVNLVVKPYNNRPQIITMINELRNLFKVLVTTRVINGRYPELDELRQKLNKLSLELSIYEHQGITKRKQHQDDYIYLKGLEQLITKMADELISLCNMDYPAKPSKLNVECMRQYGLYIPDDLQTELGVLDDNSTVFNFHLTNLLDAGYYLNEFLLL